MTWAKQLKNLRDQKEALDHLANMDVEKARARGARRSSSSTRTPSAPSTWRRWRATRTRAPSRS